MTIVPFQTEIPPLPEYQLYPLPPLLWPIPDKLLTLLLPIAAYWSLSLLFHWFDTKNYFSQYRLHTPAEVVKRNHVSRWEVVRDVLIQQIIQTAVGTLLGMSEPDDTVGKDDYEIAIWAKRIRMSQQFIPAFLALLSVDVKGLSTKIAGTYPTMAGALSGGFYPALTQIITFSDGHQAPVAAFASWETGLAEAIYWYIIPIIQFGMAIFIVDTWQYFLHRLMHTNKWLYTTFHSRHHRLYVPYAFGALYNHPFEGFLLDTLGATVGFKGTGMSTRQGMWFFTCSTIKTVDDHCGYALPWDPLQLITSNNAGYHDIHHQSWGIKTNFSQPFFTFWDRFMGTIWTGGDVSARYERVKLAAQQSVDKENAKNSATLQSSTASNAVKDNPLYRNSAMTAATVPDSDPEHPQPASPNTTAEQQAAVSREQVLTDQRNGGAQILAEEAQEEKEARSMLRKSNRRRTASSLTQSDSLRGLRDRVTMHGRAGGIIGMESSR